MKKYQTNKNKWNQEIFIINHNDEVETMTYREYVCEFGADETTSPRGIAPRIHIREVAIIVYQNIETKDLIDEEDYDNLDEKEQGNFIFYGERQNYEIWTWGVGGNHPKYLGPTFESEEDANNEVLEHFEYYRQNKNDNSPSYYNTREEAEKDRVYIASELMGVDTDVFLSIERKSIIVKKKRTEIATESNNKRTAEQQLLFEKFKNCIEKVDGESYKQTETRLSSAIGEKIQGNTFHKIVKFIRNN